MVILSSTFFFLGGPKWFYAAGPCSLLNLFLKSTLQYDRYMSGIHPGMTGKVSVLLLFTPFVLTNWANWGGGVGGAQGACV